VAERTTAEERLERILYWLPAAASPDGIALAELADRLGIDRRTLIEDVGVVTDRVWYHPPGGADNLHITITPDDRLQVWTGGPFRRPPKLSEREALCVALGLRLCALERGGDDSVGGDGASSSNGSDLSALQRRIEQHLSVASATPQETLIHVPELDARGSDVRTLLLEAARTRIACRILYLKPDGAAPEVRTLDPYALAYAEGEWYAIGHSAEAGGVRVFRLDRILAAEVDTGMFEVPADFDAAAYVSGGRVFQTDEAPVVRVRYSPRVARWIEEREDVERLEDGSVVVRHVAASPRWLVSHALRYGADAEVLEPAGFRALVREAAERALASSLDGLTDEGGAEPR
jgi:proteasome accessory factor C